jgi:ubiquinone/menaquinone biosynthesis C-methylase UbiE
VLEVGAGTGFNRPHYPPGVSELIVTDRLDGMLDRARKRAAEVGRAVVTKRVTGESLPYEDASFDTVVASFVLCSVEEQDPVLAELRRVLKPGGRYLFLEHVRFGCRCNRDTLPRIEAAFEVEEVEQGEAPKGPPKIVRPYVLGRAVKPA